MSDINLDDINLDDLNLDETGAEQDDLDNFNLGETTDKPDKTVERDLSFFHGLPVDVTLEVASTKLQLGDLMSLSSGSVIELDKLANEPLDVKVNGRLLATAEVVVVNGKYGIKLVDIAEDVLKQIH